MWWNSSADLILVIGAVGSCTVGVIIALCRSMRLSRCSKIRCLCCSCDRDIETAEEMQMELDHAQPASAPAPKTNI